ncbi:MAG: hypothetical protein LAO20_12085 [Acidobacteriia bacterium]|nr:hypothetical protein [Terriglobia bacterium]
MFSIEEIRGVMASASFRTDLALVQESLSRYRLDEQEHLFSHSALPRLRQFVECVLASAPDWNQLAREEVCKAAGEVAEALAFQAGLDNKMRFRAILLYELAGLPAISQSIASTNNLPREIKPFLSRTRGFGVLSSESPLVPAVPGCHRSCPFSRTGYELR